MSRYEEPMTKGGELVVVSFLIIAFLAVLSVWIPEVKPIGEKLFMIIAIFWFIIMMFGDAFMNFISWLGKY